MDILIPNRCDMEGCSNPGVMTLKDGNWSKGNLCRAHIKAKESSEYGL